VNVYSFSTSNEGRTLGHGAEDKADNTDVWIAKNGNI
jgi:hypothetical protein